MALVKEGQEEPRGARWIVDVYHHQQQQPKEDKKQVMWQWINDIINH